MDSKMNCCPNGAYTNVINKYYYEQVPVPVNYHTHIVKNCVKCYYPVPCYTCSEETVYVDQCQCQCQCPTNK